MKKYIYVVISVVVLAILAQSIYTQVNKKTDKSFRIECHKSTVVFEKILNKDLIQTLKKQINSGDFTISIKEEPSKYMKSKLFDFVDSKKIKDEFSSLLKQQNDTNKKGSIEIIIYENDKEDPGKKSPKSKLYAGYLVFSFKSDNSLVYKLQIDFKDEKGKDIPKILVCAKESFFTL